MKREKMLYYIIMDCLHFDSEIVKKIIDQYDIKITGDRIVAIDELLHDNWKNRLKGTPAKMNKPKGVGPLINIRKVKSGEIQLKHGYLYRVSAINDDRPNMYIYDFYIGRFDRINTSRFNPGLVFNVCFQILKRDNNEIEKKDVCRQYDYVTEQYYEKKYVIPFTSGITEIQELGNPIVSPKKLLYGEMSNKRKSIFKRNLTLQDITRNAILENPDAMKEIQGTPYYQILVQNKNASNRRITHKHTSAAEINRTRPTRKRHFTKTGTRGRMPKTQSTQSI